MIGSSIDATLLDKDLKLSHAPIVARGWGDEARRLSAGITTCVSSGGGNRAAVVTVCDAETPTPPLLPLSLSKSVGVIMTTEDGGAPPPPPAA